MTTIDRHRLEGLGLRRLWCVGATEACRLTDPTSDLAVDGAFVVEPATFSELMEYSHSLPTGTREGKVWKARHRSGWRLGRYGAPFPPGHEYHGEIPIGWLPLRVRGEQPVWPRSVAVPPPVQRGRVMEAVWPDPGNQDEAALPDGLYERHGDVVFTCLSCGDATPLECDPEEFDQDTAYCGRSPRCLP